MSFLLLFICHPFLRISISFKERENFFPLQILGINSSPPIIIFRKEKYHFEPLFDRIVKGNSGNGRGEEGSVAENEREG